MLGVKDNTGNQFILTYSGILENWEVIENNAKRIKDLLKNKSLNGATFKSKTFS